MPHAPTDREKARHGCLSRSHPQVAIAKHNRCVYDATLLLYHVFVTSQEFKRWLRKQGCSFEPGHGGHLIVRRDARMSVLPMHGKGKELGTGLVNSIRRDLGLK